MTLKKTIVVFAILIASSAYSSELDRLARENRERVATNGVDAVVTLVSTGHGPPEEWLEGEPTRPGILVVKFNDEGVFWWGDWDLHFTQRPPLFLLNSALGQ